MAWQMTDLAHGCPRGTPHGAKPYLLPPGQAHTTLLPSPTRQHCPGLSHKHSLLVGLLLLRYFSALSAFSSFSSCCSGQQVMLGSHRDTCQEADAQPGWVGRGGRDEGCKVASWQLLAQFGGLQLQAAFHALCPPGKMNSHLQAAEWVVSDRELELKPHML